MAETGSAHLQLVSLLAGPRDGGGAAGDPVSALTAGHSFELGLRAPEAGTELQQTPVHGAPHSTRTPDHDVGRHRFGRFVSEGAPQVADHARAKPETARSNAPDPISYQSSTEVRRTSEYEFGNTPGTETERVELALVGYHPIAIQAEKAAQPKIVAPFARTSAVAPESTHLNRSAPEAIVPAATVTSRSDADPASIKSELPTAQKSVADQSGKPETRSVQESAQLIGQRNEVQKVAAISPMSFDARPSQNSPLPDPPVQRQVPLETHGQLVASNRSRAAHNRDDIGRADMRGFSDAEPRQNTTSLERLTARAGADAPVAVSRAERPSAPDPIVGAGQTPQAVKPNAPAGQSSLPELSVHSEIEISTEGALREAGATDAPAPKTETMANRPLIIRSLAHQLAGTVSLNLVERPVELALEPVELGRVRLTLSASDAGFNITILAERPETLDLMRRNAEALSTEFEALGYASVSLSFGEAGGGHDRHENHSANTGFRGDADAELTEPAQASPVRLTLGTSEKLDIRL